MVLNFIFNGEDGKDFVTVERCGDDFLTALANAMQDTEDWEDLEAIKTEVSGTLSKIIETNISNDNGVETGPAFGSSVIGKHPYIHLTEDSLKRLSTSIDDEDSDLEILSQKNSHSLNYNRKRGQAASRTASKQPLISTEVRYPSLKTECVKVLHSQTLSVGDIIRLPQCTRCPTNLTVKSDSILVPISRLFHKILVAARFHGP